MMMPRTCSQCGTTGHNSRTCSDGDSGDGEKSILLFGVRVTQGKSFRKSASMTDLSQYEEPPPLPHDDSNNAHDTTGYASDDVLHASGHSRERKRGIPWTEEEHRLFLLGLERVGKGDWRGISRNFVKTRTPTQVASHAQKYFIRRHNNNNNRRRRRSSLFDITTDTVMESATSIINEGIRVHQEAVVPPRYPYYGAGFGGSSFQMTPVGAKVIRPTPMLPVAPSVKMANLNLREEVHQVVSAKISGAGDSSSMISVA